MNIFTEMFDNTIEHLIKEVHHVEELENENVLVELTCWLPHFNPMSNQIQIQEKIGMWTFTDIKSWEDTKAFRYFIGKV
jgi:hypothetical protein